MNSTDPKIIAMQYNEFINHQDAKGLASLMTDDHRFIDRAGARVTGKESMTRAWIRFFEMFPEYHNTFEGVESRGNLVIVQGFATWKKEGEPDAVIWTVRIEDGLVAEWRIYEDTEENRMKFTFSKDSESNKS